jgi:hypothetical protein
MKIITVLFLGVFGFVAPRAWGACQTCIAGANLPASAIMATSQNTDHTISTSFLTGWLKGVGPGYGVSDGPYNAWCVDIPTLPILGSFITKPLYSTYAPVIFSTSANWGTINWVLNNRTGYVYEDVQRVIWQLLGNTPLFPQTTASDALLAAANANGANFVPGQGQIMGVVLAFDGPGGSIQDVMIEVPAPNCGTIGDFVWSDNNGDGLQTPGEPGINGVTVNLLNAVGAPIASTITANAPAGYLNLTPNSPGYYQFTGLCAGNYAVALNSSQPALSGYTPSPTLVGGNNAIDSNLAVSPVVLATDTSIDETIDFGFFASNPIQIACASSTGQQGVAYSSMIAVTGGTSPFTFSIASGGLPNGLGLNAFTGAISGTPLGFGSSAFTVLVVDSSGSAAGTKSTGCGIVAAPPPVVLQCAAGAGQVGTPYNSSLVASGGTGGFTYSIIGSLPAGLTLNATTGAIAGTPTAFGTFPFTASVVDSHTTRATASCPMAISRAVAAGAYTTYTQGGWGANPHGNNPGALLQANFSKVYPGGSVSIGFNHKLEFASASAIANFLPQGGRPGVLTTGATNPSSSSAGVFAGQVLALQLSVDFSHAGITQGGLAALHLTSGALAGQTVTQVLGLANTVIGGGTSALPSGLSVSGLNSIIDSINNNFDNGTANNGYLK